MKKKLLIQQAGQWLTSVALDTHTVIGQGGVDIINHKQTKPWAKPQTFHEMNQT